MNDLSFWLYAIQLLSTLYVLSWTIGVIAGIAAAFTLLMMTANRNRWKTWKRHDDPKENPWEEHGLITYLNARYIFRITLPLSIVMILLGVIIPDLKTMHMMLASEAGEFVINSEASKMAYEALISILKGYAQ